MKFKNINFIIVAPSYSENSGGVIALHTLCHILNSHGYRAYLYHFYGSGLLNGKSIYASFFEFARYSARKVFRSYQTSGEFITPIFNGKLNNKNTIVIYPEIVIGNPLNASNVVRWFLYTPGGHNGVISVNERDLLVDYNAFLTDYSFGSANIYPSPLYVTSIPWQIYNTNDAFEREERRGTAYCLRKGANRKISHDLSDSILIDGLSHFEVARILKSVKTFYSYDLHTAYSYFACLCGADSIIVPDDKVSLEQWKSIAGNPYGIAYGEANLKLARDSRHLLKAKMESDEDKMREKVDDFAQYAINYFEIARESIP